MEKCNTPRPGSNLGESLRAEMSCSQTCGKLTAALAKAQKIGMNAELDGKRGSHQGGAKFATLKSVLKACREPLASNGLAVLQGPGNSGFDGSSYFFEVWTILAHDSGEWIKAQVRFNPKNLSPHEVGSCLTYGRRYLLSSLTGIADEDDDDGNLAQMGEKVYAQPSQKMLKKPDGHKPVKQIDRATTVQITHLEDLLKNKEIDWTPFPAWLKEKYGVETAGLTKLSSDQLKTIIQKLESKIAATREAQKEIF